MKKTILHFSPNEALRTNRNLILSNAGYTVLSADTEAIAQALARATPCDALILCSSASPLAGRAIVAALLFAHRVVPVIAFGDQHRKVADISIGEFTALDRWLGTLAAVFTVDVSAFPTETLLAPEGANGQVPHSSGKYWTN